MFSIDVLSFKNTSLDTKDWNLLVDIRQASSFYPKVDQNRRIILVNNYFMIQCLQDISGNITHNAAHSSFIRAT